MGSVICRIFRGSMSPDPPRRQGPNLPTDALLLKILMKPLGSICMKMNMKAEPAYFYMNGFTRKLVLNSEVTYFLSL